MKKSDILYSKLLSAKSKAIEFQISTDNHLYTFFLVGNVNPRIFKLFVLLHKS